MMAALNHQFSQRRLLLCDFMESCNRKRLRNGMATLTALGVSNPKKRKRIWRRERSNHWWTHIVPGFDDKEWYENFRMKKGTFDWLCSQLESVLKPNPNPVASGHIPTDKRVAIALYKLAHVAKYTVVENLFGVHKSSVHNCLYSVCIALIEVLHKEYIKFPDDDEAEEISKRFECLTCLPHIIGIIDCLHIPINPPKDGRADYINRKTFPSLILQTIVDDQYIFRDISCKLPGSCNDIEVFRESNFYKNADNIMPKGTKSVDGKRVMYSILGDPAYPLMLWLLKNYNYDENMSPAKDYFNVNLNNGRLVGENAVGRLKARWRILCKQSEVNYKFMPKIILACCILHNICEMSKEKSGSYNELMERWVTSATGEEEFDQPDNVPYDDENMFHAEEMRDHLMLYLSRKCD